MSGLNKGLGKVEVRLKWAQSPLGAPDHDLDLVAAAYPAEDLYGTPAYLVYWDGRSPEGTITLNRDSRTGQGFGTDEAMTLEFDRISPEYGRVVVGVVIQQGEQRTVFGEVSNASVRTVDGYDELSDHDFSSVAQATCATVAEFTRDETGAWVFHDATRGFQADPESFGSLMSGKPG